MVGWQMSRQMEANNRIAHMLKHDYPGWTVSQIANKLNKETLKTYEVKNENS